MDDTLNDACKYALALVTADMPEASRIQNEYQGEKLRELFGAVGGVTIGIFSNVSMSLRKQLESSLRYAVTGDESFLQAAKAVDDMPGQYL